MFFFYFFFERKRTRHVVVQIFSAHRGSVECVMCMFLYILVFMDHTCTLGAAVCHQVEYEPDVALNSLKIFLKNMSFISLLYTLRLKQIRPTSVTRSDAYPTRSGGRGFVLRRVGQHSFVEIDHEIFSAVILSFPQIQKGQLSNSGERFYISTG